MLIMKRIESIIEKNPEQALWWLKERQEKENSNVLVLKFINR